MLKRLLITYDYELYLGNRSGTVDDCMIHPTEKLLATMEPFGIRAVFFVDTTYLMRLQEKSEHNQKCQNDFQTVAGQLRELVARGHYVFPHIHPHWLDAEYNNVTNQWRLNNVTRYRFHNLTESDKFKVFSGSVNVLSGILHPAFPDYKIDGYRAGGWCIQPFTDFIPFFRNHEIKYEFSVFGGIYQFTDAQYFDFSNAPDKPVYRFSSDVCTEDPDGNFTQFNINSINISPAVTLANKIWMKLKYRLPGDHRDRRGEGQPSRELSGMHPVNPGGHDLSHPGRERISVEDLTPVKLPSYLKFFGEQSYMHFISHPKMVTGFNLIAFKKFLQKVFDNYKIETDFHKMIAS
jgi:hypothetical protein